MLVLAIFVIAALAVFVSGTRLTRLVDRLADRTGLGEAIAGAILLGGSTSLSGTIVSVTAAFEGHASLAFSNSIGGIAAQTAFLAIADLTYRKANLEHAGAELVNVFQAIVLFGLLMLPMLALTLPEVTIWSVHPVSLVIPVVYVLALVASRTLRATPMWKPVSTPYTREDQPDTESTAERRHSTAFLFAQFIGLVVVMGFAGWMIASTATVLMERFAVSASLVGALATATVTSMPELVTTLAAVRRGSLQLAIGGIIGGNTFDTLFLPAADVFYRDGSLYHAATMADFFWIVVAALMTTVLLAGLILRQRFGPARIGLESVALLGIYACAIAVQVFVTGA
ncbi:sodium:calcium antiporter [Stappia stellulata]|uniref:sodium:calcium antiporter n=1 Tax=Stappia stellulata TaxID=71235 RepID=UPI00040C7F90|nr:sodium:calcium antiporter [Stappia stellulata]